MRISWLEPDIVRHVRSVLLAWRADWGAHFCPEFRVPPAPPSISPERWPKVAEHVARAERVAHDIREHGLYEAVTRYGDSEHAVEIATVIAASMQSGSVRFDLVIAVLDRSIDDLVVYGPFLQLVLERLADERERVLAAYECFCDAAVNLRSDEPMWNEWVGATRDGLADVYVRCGRLDEAQEVFAERHQDESTNLIVALAASRAFLSAGHVARAANWLALGAERAQSLGRSQMADRLRAKQQRLLSRL